MNREADGEPVTPGRRDRNAAERRAFGDALFLVVGLAIAWAATGLLAMLLIEVFRAVGLWDPAVAIGTFPDAD